MSHALVIATRELREKGRIFTLALILAVLPFAATLAPAMRGWDKAMIVGFFGGMLGVALGLGLAIALGATTIGRELSDRRLSFYFAKPVSTASIWFGKAAANIFTALACFAIIAVPALIVARNIWGSAWTLTQPQFVRLVAAATVVLFLVSHALSTMVRSRSALLGLDLALMVGTGFALVSMVRPLLAGQAVRLALGVGEVVLIGFTLVLLAAPVWQLAKGRADLRRNHVALSRFVWTGVAVVLLFAAGYVAWAVHPSPSDIKRGFVTQAPSGGWMHVHGETRNRADYVASFLLDTKSGTRVRMPLPWMGPVFSRDGRVAALTAGDVRTANRSEDLTLSIADLGEAKPRLRETKIQPGNALALSDDGRRLMTIDRSGIVSVHDVAREALLVSARGLEARAYQAAVFLTPDLVRIWQYHNDTKQAVEIFELDVPRKSLTKTGETPLHVRYRGLSVTGDGSRALLHDAGLLIDGRTGATIKQFPTGMGGVILNDGTVVLVERAAGRMHVFDANGHPLRQVALPAAEWVRIGAELEGGRIALTTVTRPRIEHAFIVDVKNGRVVHQQKGVHVSVPWFSADPRVPLLGAGVDVALARVGGGVSLWDPETGRTTAL